VPTTEAERAAVREQLDRILASPQFRNSKRYPNLLRYVVEHALDGRAGHLKERTLGVEVFHRAPDYDSNLDPVVRTTAVEIRKRIGQYYQEPGRESEIRIGFPAGSYVPEFRIPPAKVVEEPVQAPPAAQKRLPAFGWIVLAAAVLAAILIVSLISRSNPSPTALDRFWSPVWNSPSPVLLLIGRSARRAQPPSVTPAAVTLGDLMAEETVAFADSTTLAKLTGLMSMKGKPVHIRRFASAKLEDLRDGPAVLIGAFNNEWTLRLTGQMRFHFERDNLLGWISDQQNPNSRQWLVDRAAPIATVPEDYGIISRVQDPTTGRLVVIAAGLTKFGTGAAGELLTDPQYLQSVARTAPKDWDRKNIQIVFATKLVGESSGPPRIIATYFW